MKNVKFSTAFNPRYENIVQQLMKRQLVVQFSNGESKALDLNKKESFMDISVDDRQNITALRLIIGRETVTISRKIDDSHTEGFFYHLMERERPASSGGNRQTPLLQERIGFCYQADGEAVEFLFNYHDILVQLSKRDQMKKELQDQIDTTFDSDDLITLTDKLNRLLSAQLSFNIRRFEQENNIISMGVNIPEFYKLSENEIKSFQPVFQEYRKEIITHKQLGTQPQQPLKLPLLPRLTEIGIPATVTFTVRTSGSVDG